MKEQWSISNEKLISVEEGHGSSIPDKKSFTYLKPVSTHHMCEQIIQCVKLILYLELLLFVGWASYTIWQSYHIDSMEAKVIDNIREEESKNLFGQQSMFDKSTVAPEESHTSEDKVVLTNPIGHVGEQPFNEEHDIIPIAKPDRDFPTKDSESSSVLKVDSAKDVEINESDKDTTVYNYSEIQDHSITEEPKQVENGKEENSEYYALLSLLLQNAMKTEPMKDHTTDSSINLQDDSVLSGSIYTPIDGFENLEIQEDQEKENQGNWEYMGNQENWYQENMGSQVYQESQENLENLNTQGNLENQENWETEDDDEILESEVNRENQDYQDIQKNVGIVDNYESQENLYALGNQENQQSASGIQESPEILENVETPILIMDDDYFKKNWKMLSMLRTSKDSLLTDKYDDHFERTGDMLRIDYDDGLDDFDYRHVPYLKLEPSSNLEKTDTLPYIPEYPYLGTYDVVHSSDPYLFL